MKQNSLRVICCWSLFGNLPEILDDIPQTIIKLTKFFVLCCDGVMKGDVPVCFILAVPSLHDRCPTYYTPSLTLKNRLPVSLFSSPSQKENILFMLILKCDNVFIQDNKGTVTDFMSISTTLQWFQGKTCFK